MTQAFQYYKAYHEIYFIEVVNMVCSLFVKKTSFGYKVLFGLLVFGIYRLHLSLLIPLTKWKNSVYPIVISYLAHTRLSIILQKLGDLPEHGDTFFIHLFQLYANVFTGLYIRFWVLLTCTWATKKSHHIGAYLPSMEPTQTSLESPRLPILSSVSIKGTQRICNIPPT